MSSTRPIDGPGWDSRPYLNSHGLCEGRRPTDEGRREYDGAMLKPVLAAGLLLTAAGAWYWALSPAAAPTAVTVREAREAASAVVPYVRLDRLAGATRVKPDRTERDPFRNGRVGIAGAAHRRLAAAPVVSGAVMAQAPTVATWPRLDLIGVAEARDGASTAYTAILSGPRGVHHARAGDTVEQVYRLERVTQDGADLRLLPEDRVVRLALRP